MPGDPIEPIMTPVPLLALLGLAVLCSLAGGYVCGAISLSQSTRAVTVLGVFLFATGCFVQSTVWHLMPLWYHVIFLGLVIPVTLVGGTFGRVSRT